MLSSVLNIWHQRQKHRDCALGWHGVAQLPQVGLIYFKFGKA